MVQISQSLTSLMYVSVFCLDYKLIDLAFKITLFMFQISFKLHPIFALDFGSMYCVDFYTYVGLKIQGCTSNSRSFKGLSSASISAWHILFLLYFKFLLICICFLSLNVPHNQILTVVVGTYQINEQPKVLFSELFPLWSCSQVFIYNIDCY